MPAFHQGGYHGGALRYQCEAPLQDIAHGHCTICRRSLDINHRHPRSA